MTKSITYTIWSAGSNCVFLTDNDYLYHEDDCEGGDDCCDHVPVRNLTENEAIEFVVNCGYDDHCGVATNALKMLNADANYLRIMRAVRRLSKKLGWKITHNENTSLYIRFNDIVVRISDHHLGSDWTGRAQTGGADVDFVWEGQDLSAVINIIGEDLEGYI